MADSCVLSFDLKMEVFSRASLKTLDTLRCTSREFEKLTYESYFLNLYKQRNSIVSGFLVQNIKRGWEYIKHFAPSPQSNPLDLRFLPFNARILATSDQAGILVFESPHPHPKGICTNDLYHVCKPTTKQVLPLPNPKTKYTTEKTAIVVVAGSNPILHYKIIRLSKPKCSVLQRRGKLYSTYRCEIFDSKTWKWRLLDLVMLPYGVFLTCPQPITTSGSIYMLLTDNQILKIDAISEEWTLLLSPISTSLEDDTNYSKQQLVKYEGRLGLACKPAANGNGGWEIWVLTPVDGSWERISYECNKKLEDRSESLEGFYDSETSIMVDGDTLVFHRFKEGYNMSKVVLHDTPYQIFSFRSDYEPTHLKLA